MSNLINIKASLVALASSGLYKTKWGSGFKLPAARVGTIDDVILFYRMSIRLYTLLLSNIDLSFFHYRFLTLLTAVL